MKAHHKSQRRLLVRTHRRHRIHHRMSPLPRRLLLLSDPFYPLRDVFLVSRASSPPVFSSMYS